MFQCICNSYCSRRWWAVPFWKGSSLVQNKGNKIIILLVHTRIYCIIYRHQFKPTEQESLDGSALWEWRDILYEIYKMNLITNYHQLSLGHWDSLARTACFEVNQQAKSSAERVFYHLAETPNTHLIMSLINTGSETLVFVLFSYLSKYPHKFGNNLHSVTDLVSCISSWQFTAFTFIRNSAPPFQKYVTRTIMSSLGIFLKILYQDSATSTELSIFLANLKSNFFKLYLLKSFIDAVEVVDYDMGYIKYRTMVYSFQDSVIPMICETLMPYFQNIEEGLQISELSLLQQKLDVSDSASMDYTTHSLITNDQQLETDYIFMLLEKIVDFNYNITYSEYESDTAIDTCLITFPDKVSEKIHNNQFLDALFFIIEKISSVKQGERRHQYLETSLKCVAKLVQSRLYYLNSEIKDRYFYHALKGLTHLLIKCQQIGSETLLQGIIICNRKLFMNCDLKYLRHICQAQSGKDQLYKVHMNNLGNMINMVILKSPLHVENNLLLQALQLACKMLSIFGMKEQLPNDPEVMFFQDFTKKLVYDFIDNLAVHHPIFQQTKIISILQCKPIISLLFENFKKIGSTNFVYLFSKISQKIDDFIQERQSSLIVFANILYLLSELVDRNYLQRNLYIVCAKDSDYCLFGQLIKKVIELIQRYVTSRKDNYNEDSIYADSAIVIFMQTITLQFLIGFDCSNRFRIKQRLFLFMEYGQFYNQFQQFQDERSEDTIIAYLTILIQYVKFAASSNQYQVLIQYALSSIEKCIFKLKWHMRRQLYLKTRILSFLSHFFEGFFYNWNYINSVRSRVSKILVTLTFDDVLDQYKFRINKFINILKDQPPQLMQFDLIGLFQGIEAHSISKYFYRKLRKTINLQLMLNHLFQTANQRNQEKNYADFCKLLKSMTNNKGFRISNNVIVYQLFELVIYYLTIMLKKINESNSINMDFWQTSIVEIMQIFKGVLAGTHINIFMMESYSRRGDSQISKVKQFIIQILKTVILLSNCIDVFPEMQQLMLSICTQINKSLLDYVLTDQSGQLVQTFAFLHLRMMDITVGYIKRIINGNKGIEDKIIKILDCLRSFFVCFNRKCKNTHQKLQMNNLRSIYDISQNFSAENGTESKNLHLITFMINFIFASDKNNTIFIKTITRVLYQLSQIFNSYFLTVLSKFPLREDQIKQVEQIVSGEERDGEENFTEKVKVWIKDVMEVN